MLAEIVKVVIAILFSEMLVHIAAFLPYWGARPNVDYTPYPARSHLDAVPEKRWHSDIIYCSYTVKILQRFVTPLWKRPRWYLLEAVVSVLELFSPWGDRFVSRELLKDVLPAFISSYPVFKFGVARSLTYISYVLYGVIIYKMLV